MEDFVEDFKKLEDSTCTSTLAVCTHRAAFVARPYAPPRKGNTYRSLPAAFGSGVKMRAPGHFPPDAATRWITSDGTTERNAGISTPRSTAGNTGRQKNVTKLTRITEGAAKKSRRT